MDDRTLLELTAKAAMIEPTEFQSEDTDNLWINVGESGVADWNPLINDGDALRLAVKLGLAVCVVGHEGYTRIWEAGAPDGSEDTPHGSDPYAATRRAIVRAAAALSPPSADQGDKK